MKHLDIFEIITNINDDLSLLKDLKAHSIQKEDFFCFYGIKMYMILRNNLQDGYEYSVI